MIFGKTKKLIEKEATIQRLQSELARETRPARNLGEEAAKRMLVRAAAAGPVDIEKLALQTHYTTSFLRRCWDELKEEGIVRDL